MNQNPGEDRYLGTLAPTACEPTLPPTAGAREWCEGVPLIGTRALTIAERDELQVMDATARGRTVGGGCVTLLVFFSSIGVAAFYEDSSLYLLGMLMLLSIPTYLVFLTLRVRDVGQRARLSLATNTVSLYSYQHQAETGEQSSTLRGEIHRALHPDEALSSLGVLTGGRTLWTVNGRRATSAAPFWGRSQPTPTPRSVWPRLRRKPHLRRVARTPGTVSVEQRVLSNRERDELYALSEQWKPLWPLMAVCGLAFGVLLTNGLGALLGGTATSLGLLFYSATVLTGWPFLRWVRLVARCLRLKRDYYWGSVDVEHCFYPAHEMAPPLAAVPPWPPGTETVEVLPASGRVWTHDGQIAAWRPSSEVL